MIPNSLRSSLFWIVLSSVLVGLSVWAYYQSVGSVDVQLAPLSELNVDREVHLQCDAQQTRCFSEIEDHSISLRVSPSILPPLKPLRFEIEKKAIGSRALSWQFVGAQIAGRDMFMGIHPLTKLDASPDQGLFEGLIPVCVTGHEMIWRLEFFVKISGDEASKSSETWRFVADLRSLPEV